MDVTMSLYYYQQFPVDILEISLNNDFHVTCRSYHALSTIFFSLSYMQIVDQVDIFSLHKM